MRARPRSAQDITRAYVDALMRILRAALLTLLVALAAAAPAAAQELPVPQLPDATGVVPPGPDAVMSDNVEYLGSLKQDVGLTTGAKVIGDRLFVTSGKNISIYDIRKPESPQRLGSMKVNVA